MFLVAFGLGSLVLDNPLVMTGLKWIGAAVLCWLAWKIATAGPPSSTASDKKPIGFLGAAAFQWINPKSWLVCASAAATFLEPSAGSALRTVGRAWAHVRAGVRALLPALPWLWRHSPARLTVGTSVSRVQRGHGRILAASAVFFVL